MQDARKVVLWLETSREYGRELLFGITKYSFFHGGWTFHWETGGRERTLPQLKKLGADGLIAHVSNSQMARRIISSGIPAIVKGFKVPSLPMIVTDNSRIGRMVAEHLLDRGFRNFGFCGYDGVYWSDERRESFVRSIARAGYETQIYKEPRSCAQRLWENEQKFMAEWLKALPKPVGVMTCVDDQSLHVLEVSKLAGLDVPNEVAIIGVDNDELVCRLAQPQLSSVSLAAERAGYEAAELLDKLMAGKKMTKQRILTLPTHIETRQSTDMLAVEDPEVAHALQFIRDHQNEPLQVSDVINAVALSRRALQLRFRRVLGRSILDEIRRVRTDQVAKMLAETNLPVSKIAMEMGYTGIDHIARYFRREKGMTPLAYRKRYGQK